MRNLLWAFGIGILSLSTLAQPMSWATVDPPPNPYGWHNTTVTVIIQASGGQNLRVCYQLDGGTPSCQFPPVALSISSEGIYTLKYWAEDDTGQEPPHTLTLRIDLTPPRIVVHTPARDASYLLHQNVVVDWLAYDRLSGLELVEASAQSGSFLDTSLPGHQTFWVFARDRAGNTARAEVDYRVLCVIETVLPSGFYLDRLLPPEERFLAWKFPVLARYTRGETITIAFRLLDAQGRAGPWTRPTLLVTQVRPDPEFGEKHTIWAWLSIPYDQEVGFYKLVYDTSEREPGIYDLWLSFGDSQSERLRVEILPTKEGKEGK